MLRYTMATEEHEDLMLTYQERNIIRLIADGVKTAGIAEEMGLKPETVKWYRKRILDKFQAATSAEVVRKAIEMKLI